MTGKIRLDQALVERGFYPSRSRARDAVLRGAVRVGGALASKPALTLHPSAEISVDDAAGGYVSRAALKLAAGLEATGHDPRGAIALDIGASTGGFTQLLLQRGAAKVFAIDVGHGQLHDSLRSHPHVVCIEGLNSRELSTDHLGGETPGFVVCDVSFISLTLALPPALALARTGAKGIFLIKPQFEVGRDNIGKGGVVRDAAQVEASGPRLFDWLDNQPGWRASHLLPSPIDGGDGNREFLLAGVKDR